MKYNFNLISTIIAVIISNFSVMAQCTDSLSIHAFNYNNQNYEIVKENKTWIDASACAVERGGMLAEINDSLEQDAIFAELTSNAGIMVSNTVAPDGGGGAYVWIGGNDLSVEGNWVWDGNNDSITSQFWMGTSTGTPVAGLYNNWGNEPDDFSGQDALGLSLDGWPLGIAGQWNDVDHSNNLYYVIEYPLGLGLDDLDFDERINVYPNPANDFVIIESSELDFKSLVILNSLGQELKIIDLAQNSTSQKVDLSSLVDGVYYIRVDFENGRSSVKKIIK